MIHAADPRSPGEGRVEAPPIEYPGAMARLLIAAAAAAAAALLATPGCKRAQGDIDGIGEYRLGVTTVSDGVVCTPRDSYTWCSHNAGVAIGGQAATVDLYFNGLEETATAVEILLTIQRCQEPPLRAELIEQLGKPDETAGARSVWRGKKAIIVAQLPAEPGLCEVNFVHPSETDRIAKLTAAPGS
jgi:hypothetical protein